MRHHRHDCGFANPYFARVRDGKLMRVQSFDERQVCEISALLENMLWPDGRPYPEYPYRHHKKDWAYTRIRDTLVALNEKENVIIVQTPDAWGATRSTNPPYPEMITGMQIVSYHEGFDFIPTFLTLENL
jgi:hypothetical protein